LDAPEANPEMRTDEEVGGDVSQRGKEETRERSQGRSHRGNYSLICQGELVLGWKLEVSEGHLPTTLIVRLSP
jgi:hypothetical protein